MSGIYAYKDILRNKVPKAVHEHLSCEKEASLLAGNEVVRQ